MLSFHDFFILLEAENKTNQGPVRTDHDATDQDLMVQRGYVDRLIDTINQFVTAPDDRNNYFRSRVYNLLSKLSEKDPNSVVVSPGIDPKKPFAVGLDASVGSKYNNVHGRVIVVQKLSDKMVDVLMRLANSAERMREKRYGGGLFDKGEEGVYLRRGSRVIASDKPRAEYTFDAIRNRAGLELYLDPLSLEDYVHQFIKRHLHLFYRPLPQDKFYKLILDDLMHVWNKPLNKSDIYKALRRLNAAAYKLASKELEAAKRDKEISPEVMRKMEARHKRNSWYVKQKGDMIEVNWFLLTDLTFPGAELASDINRAVENMINILRHIHKKIGEIRVSGGIQAQEKIAKMATKSSVTFKSLMDYLDDLMKSQPETVKYILEDYGQMLEDLLSDMPSKLEKSLRPLYERIKDGVEKYLKRMRKMRRMMVRRMSKR